MTAGGDVVSSSAAMPAGIAPVVARSLWCFLWSFLCGDSIDDRSWRATQRGLERPRYKHTTLLYSLAVKVFEFPPSRRLVRVCRGKFVRSSEPSGDFALTGRSPRVSLLLDKLLSPKSLLSDSHPSVSKPSSSLPALASESPPAGAARACLPVGPAHPVDAKTESTSWFCIHDAAT